MLYGGIFLHSHTHRLCSVAHASFYLNLPHVVDFSPPTALSHNICLAGAYNSKDSIVVLATHHTGNAEISFETINVVWRAQSTTYP